MTITRRLMLRLTDAIREMRKGLVIINGESLGQVASQTLQSMVAINEVTSTPIIRPVVSMDKTEIIEIAEKLTRFELAIQPFERLLYNFCATATEKHDLAWIKRKIMKRA